MGAERRGMGAGPGLVARSFGLAALALAVAGCHPQTAAITRLGRDGELERPHRRRPASPSPCSPAATASSARRCAPETPGGSSLTSPQTVSILLPDRVLGNTISLRVDGYLAGAKVTSGRADNLSPLPSRGIDVRITLGHMVTALDIMPANPTVPIGLAQQLTAQATYSDGTTGDVTDFASWTTSDDATLSVRDSAGTKGLITGHVLGMAVITATLDDQSTTTDVTVSAVRLETLSITPNPLVLPLGSNRGLTATATYSDGSHKDATATADWTSTDPNVVTIDNAGAKGTAQTVMTGTVTITAMLDGVSTNATVAGVVPALQQIVVEAVGAQGRRRLRGTPSSPPACTPTAAAPLDVEARR